MLKPGGTIVEPTSGNTGTRSCDGRRDSRLPVHSRDARQDVEGKESICCAPTAPRSSSRPRTCPTIRPSRITASRIGSPRRSQAPFSRISFTITTIRTRTITRPARRSGSRRAARSRISSPASAPAARSRARLVISKEKKPAIHVVGADPEGSIYSGDTPRSYAVEGIGMNYLPETVDLR